MNGIPRYFPGEEKAITQVIKHAKQHGFGNLIHELKLAWSKMLQTDLDEVTADMASGLICVYCKRDTRTGKKVKIK